MSELNGQQPQNDLPDGWTQTPLIQVLTALETGNRPRGGAVGVTGGVPSLSAEHINRFGTFKFQSIRYVPRQFYNEMKRGHIQKGDILIVKDGATTGKVAFVDEQFPFDEAVVNEHVFLCRPNTEKVLPKFLFLWLWSSEGQSAIRKNYQGAAIGGINQKFAHVINLPLPPLVEQERIATILSNQMTMVEKARACIEAQLAAAKATPTAILRQIFESPEARQWPRKQLAEICRLLPSKSIATDGDTKVHAITTACLTESGFKTTGIKEARMWEKDAKECVVSKGEILIARSNTPDLVGRVSLFAGEIEGVVASDLTIRVLPTDPRCSQFLASYLSFLYVSRWWKEQAGGASGSMKKITRQQISDTQVPFPPIERQQEIAGELGNKWSHIEAMRTALAEQLILTSKLSTTLLKQAFSGKL